MRSLPLFVGLDYHNRLVQVCVMDESGSILGNRSIENRVELIEKYVSRFGTPKGLAIEACCGAANLADELGNRTGWSIDLAHPGYVARMKRGPDKTDCSDASLLADLLRVGYLPVVWLAPEKIRTLRSLVRYRNQLVKDRRNVKLRIRSFLRERRRRCPGTINPWTKAWLAWLANESFSEHDRWLLDQQLIRMNELQARIKESVDRLRLATRNDVVVQKLMQLEGVGLITAVTLRSEIGRFDRFSSGKKLARFCSVSPRNASSGERQADAGIVKAGSNLLRGVIIETAHRLIWRMDTRWSRVAHRLIRNGKHKNVAVAAVANRWIRWLHHQFTMEGLAA